MRRAGVIIPIAANRRRKGSSVELWIVLGVIVVIALFLIAMYNRLITLRQRVREAWSDIDVQLKRRHDLIPNLVATVKGYAAHESGVFERVTQARANAIAAGQTGNPAERAAAENVLTGALRSVFAVAENYPQLQAVQEFKDLSENLTATEDKIAFARRFYNGNVRDYNTSLQTFPTNILAGMFGFTIEQYFELSDATEREVPKVSFT
jgi:LemA protein